MRPLSGLCQKGFKCPAGASAQIACDGKDKPSDYQDQEGQSVCKTCPAGYWCSDSLRTRCRPGDEQESYYCPSTTREKVKCDAGYFTIKEAPTVKEDCLACPPGSFCPAKNVDGKVYEKIELCLAGSFCPGANAMPITCPIGFYCPYGSNIPVPCTSGMYCDTTGLIEPAGECDPGYFCTYTTIPNEE